MLIPMNSKFKKKKVQESSRMVSYDKVCAKRTFPPGGMICHTWYKSLILEQLSDDAIIDTGVIVQFL